jgi:NAD(P)H-dependent flavin oxidoreductase YrpB (nitropropane dioxygenase family)
MARIDRRGLLHLLGLGSLALATGYAGAAAAGGGGDCNGNGNGNGGPGGKQDGLLNTRIVKDYGVTYPFVGAGMGFVALADLAAAVANAGGIGMIGSATMSPPALLTQIQTVQSMTSGLFGVDYLVATGPEGAFTTDAHIDASIQAGVKLAVFFWDVPDASWVDDLHASGAKVWMHASSLDLALAAADLGVDAIVAQGSQAGGHCPSTTPALVLLEQVLNALGHLPVLTSGGIADGATAANAFAHGADGVWVGTRLVASTEAYANVKWKQRIVQTTSPAETAITTMFGPEWPDKPMRVLRNLVVNQWAGRESQIPNPPPPPAVIGETLFAGAPYAMPKFSAVLPTPDTTGDFEQMALPGGQESAPLVNDIKPAAEIVVEMMQGAKAILSAQFPF